MQKPSFSELKTGLGLLAGKYGRLKISETVTLLERYWLKLGRLRLLASLDNFLPIIQIQDTSGLIFDFLIVCYTYIKNNIH